jgi:glycosyltransferase involved in cell wall biosynthesis
MKPLLLLSTLHRNHAAHSGYQELAAHLPEARFLHTIRADPKGGLPLFAARVARQVSFSRWYLGGCAQLEYMALHNLRAGFAGIIHSMWTDHDLGFLDLFLDRKRHRLVGSFHNCDDTFIDTIRFPRRLRGFDAIILMSRTQEDFFLDAGVAPDRIHVVPHGVDTEYFKPGTPPKKSFVVLATGGYRRNFPLLRDVCKLLEPHSDIRVEIVAPPAWRELFDDAPNTRFRTGLDNEEFLDSYQSCSCLLQTVENATANNVILEAMACGQPVVAEEIGGIPEYVDSSCGLLAPAGDADALVEAILELKNSPAKRDALAVGARQKALTFDWENIAQRMREIYQQL